MMKHIHFLSEVIKLVIRRILEVKQSVTKVIASPTSLLSIDTIPMITRIVITFFVDTPMDIFYYHVEIGKCAYYA